jgi:hypothetical protein
MVLPVFIPGAENVSGPGLHNLQWIAFSWFWFTAIALFSSHSQRCYYYIAETNILFDKEFKIAYLQPFA